MSLAVLADHMASKGRGSDSMLIHMSPREVQGLQALAVKNGGSLTINPDTGLPEAGFLEKLLPAVIGAGVSYFSGGTINPAMIGLGVGAFESVRTGDLGRGISAGLGAYGGAGLGEGLMNAGIGSMSQAAGAGLSEEAAQQAVASKLASATPMETLSAGFNAAKASPAAMGAFAKNNLSNLGFAAAPLMAMQPTTKMPEPQDTGYIRQYDYNINPNTGRPDPTYGMRAMPLVKASEFKDKTFEGQRERFRQENPYDTGVPRKTEAAGGGLMGMDDGGYSPGQLNFAERSEPVVRMARGGVPGYAGNPTDGSFVGAAQPPQTIQGLYESIGRDVKDIDKAGLDYWTNQLLGSGDTTISADDLSHFRNAAQPELANRQAAIQQPMMAATNVANTNVAGTGTNVAGTGTNVAGTNVANTNVAGTGTGAAPTIAQQLETRYQNTLYRAPDPGGLKYWTEAVSKDGVFSDEEKAAFDTAAKPEQMVGDIYRNILKRDPDSGGLTYWTGRINAGESPEKVYAELLAFANKNAENVAADTSYGAATKAYTGYRSTDQINNADEWVRNTLGREPTNEDRKQSWYKDAANALNTVASTNTAYGQFQDYAKTVAPAVIAQNIKDATKALNARGLTDADVEYQTGKTIAELVTSGIDPTKSLAAASQLRAPGTKAGFDFSGIKKAPTKTLLDTNPQTNAPPGTTNPYGNVNTPGDITRNADGSTTVTPNIPGRPFGGFSGMDEVRGAYTGGGGSLGYTSPAPKTIEEFNAKYNNLTGDSQAAYDYLTKKKGKVAYPTKTTASEVARSYAEETLGVAPNIALKKMLFDPVTKTYKPNPDYTPISYTKEGKRVIGKSDREVAAALTASEAAKTKVPAATGGLLSLANGGVLNFNQGDVVKDNTADFANWVKVNNISMEQVARALGITVAEAEKKYGTKDKAKDDISGFKGYAGYGENASNDPSVDSNPGWSALSDSSKAAYFANPKNHFEADLRGLAQKGFSFTPFGKAQNFFDPTIQSREAMITAGIDPGTGLQGQGAGVPTGLYGDKGVFDSKGNLLGYDPSIYGTPTSYDPNPLSQTMLDSFSQAYTEAAVAAANNVAAGQAVAAENEAAAAGAAAAAGMSVADSVGGSSMTGEARGGLNLNGKYYPPKYAQGGLSALAQGGMYNLGDYSDGGRLLRGPGDGVSDSIPATIGKKQPARLADGEFVVPARIVSELGNGSTEAGARKLYAMMERVQRARRKTTGKNKVAANSRSDKYLPA